MVVSILFPSVQASSFYKYLFETIACVCKNMRRCWFNKMAVIDCRFDAMKPANNFGSSGKNL